MSKRGSGLQKGRRCSSTDDALPAMTAKRTSHGSHEKTAVPIRAETHFDAKNTIRGEYDSVEPGFARTNPRGNTLETTLRNGGQR